MMSRTERERFLPDGLTTERIEVSGTMVVVHARASSATSACPWCGQASRRQHSRYQRRLADLPAYGREVRIVLSVRRFRCRAPSCGTKIFAEHFDPSITRPHARRTSRLQGLVRHLGLALGGRPAQALAGRLSLPVRVSRDDLGVVLSQEFRHLRLVCERKQPRDQPIQARREEDEVAARHRAGVGVRRPGRQEHRRAGRCVEAPVGEVEAQDTIQDVPALVVGSVDVEVGGTGHAPLVNGEGAAGRGDRGFS